MSMDSSFGICPDYFGQATRAGIGYIALDHNPYTGDVYGKRYGHSPYDNPSAFFFLVRHNFVIYVLREQGFRFRLVF